MTDPIKAKIQELCPDVMEQKLGCRTDEGGICLGGGWWAFDTAMGWETVDNCDGQIILGSPITLAVVLRAISEPLTLTLWPDNRLLLNPNFEGEKHIFWNLEEDNYDQQSEECKQFIGKLIGV